VISKQVGDETFVAVATIICGGTNAHPVRSKLSLTKQRISVLSAGENRYPFASPLGAKDVAQEVQWSCAASTCHYQVFRVRRVA